MAETFSALAGLIIAVVMLRSQVFGKVTAVVGIVGNVLEFGPPGVFAPASIFSVFVVLLALSGMLLVIWYLLMARRFFQLAQGRVQEVAKQPAVS